MVKFHSFLHWCRALGLGLISEHNTHRTPDSICRPWGARSLWEKGEINVPYLPQFVLSTQSVTFSFSPNWKLRSGASPTVGATDVGNKSINEIKTEINKQKNPHENKLLKCTAPLNLL